MVSSPASQVSSEASSEGGAPLRSPSSSSSDRTETGRQTMNDNALVRFVPARGPPPEPTFQDVRDHCARAQAQIMRLQQATHNQVGLASNIREQIYDELKDISRHFIAASQVATTIERVTSTKMAQIKGSLKSALGERDLAQDEKASALQEVDVLRSRLRERDARDASNKDEGWGTKSAEQLQYETALHSKCQEWIAEQDKKKSQAAGKQREVVARVASPPPSKGKAAASSGGSRRNITPRATAPPFYPAATDQQALKVMEQQMSMLNFDMPGPSQPFNLPVTPLAHRAFRPVDQTSSSLYGPLASSAVFPGSGQTYQPSHNNITTPAYVAQPRTSFAQRGRRDTGSSGGDIWSSSGGEESWSSSSGEYSSSSLHPSASASIANLPALALASAPAPAPVNNIPELTLAQTLVGDLSLDAAPSCMLSPKDSLWNQEMFTVFRLVLGWVRVNCSIVDPVVTRQLQSRFPRLWDYICTVTYADQRSNANNHATFMLNHEKVRPLFVTRLLVQYIVQKMWDAKAWETMDEELSQSLTRINRRLERTYGYDEALAPHERYSLVHERASIIDNFIRGPFWDRAKSQQLTRHANRFKDIVGPLMNSGVDRGAAAADLSTICERAMRVSAVLNSTDLSFQFTFNECGRKVTHQVHHVLNDAGLGRDQQLRHWRIMIAVTPGVTYRHDAGATIDPRMITKSNIVAMP